MNTKLTILKLIFYSKRKAKETCPWRICQHKSLSVLDYAMVEMSIIYKKFLKGIAEDAASKTSKQDHLFGEKQKKILNILHLFYPRIY